MKKLLFIYYERSKCKWSANDGDDGDEYIGGLNCAALVAWSKIINRPLSKKKREKTLYVLAMYGCKQTLILEWAPIIEIPLRERLTISEEEL